MALDIGTEAVKAMVFEKYDEKYYILGLALQYFDELRPFDNNKVIFNAKEEAINQAGRNPKELLLSFPPNILRSRVQTIEVSRPKPEKIIEPGEAKDIIENALKRTEKEIAGYFVHHSGIMPDDIQFVDKGFLEIKIDGYNVPHLRGYKGKKLEFMILASFLPRGYLEKSQGIFKGDDFLLRIANPVKNLKILGIADGIFLDIGGITQICLIKNGKMEFIDDFEMGSDDFSRVISQTLGMRLSDARMLKERYSMGDLTEETRGRIKEILSPTLEEWKYALKSKIQTIKGLVPSVFFVFGGGSRLPEIEELLTDEDKEVKFIYPKDFQNIIDNTNCLNSPQFTNLIFLMHD